MKVFLATVAFLPGLSLIPLFLLSFWSSRQLFGYLKEHHPTVWQQLDEPNIWNGDENVNSPPVRYFTTQQFLDIPDQDLHALGISARSSLYWASSAFCLFIFTYMAAVTGGHMGWL